MKVKLTKVSSKHDNLRTVDVVGETAVLPEVGTHFALRGDPLNPEQGNIRAVFTSLITEIKEIDKNLFEFKTENSTYTLQVLEN